MGDRRCFLCDAPPEVVEAVHIVPVSDDGRDWGTSTGDTSNWAWSPWSLAVFRSGGSAVLEVKGTARKKKIISLEEM